MHQHMHDIIKQKNFANGLVMEVRTITSNFMYIRELEVNTVAAGGDVPDVTVGNYYAR